MDKMWSLLKELLKQETMLVTKYRAKGALVLKPSTIAVAIIALLYLLSPVDLVPEKWIEPKVFGYIDDIIIIALAAMYAYGDVGGVVVNAEVRPEPVPVKEEPSGPIIVPSEDRSSDHLVPVPASVSRDSLADSLEAFVRTSSVPVGDSYRNADDDTKAADNETASEDTDDIYASFLKSRGGGSDGKSGGGINNFD